MSEYFGVRVQRLESGEIIDVQVQEHAQGAAMGNAVVILPERYIKEGIKPPINELPDLNGRYWK